MLGGLRYRTAHVRPCPCEQGRSSPNPNLPPQKLPTQFRKLGYAMVDYIASYIDGLDSVHPVRAEVQPGYLRPRLPDSAPEQPGAEQAPALCHAAHACWWATQEQRACAARRLQGRWQAAQCRRTPCGRRICVLVRSLRLTQLPMGLQSHWMPSCGTWTRTSCPAQLTGRLAAEQLGHLCAAAPGGKVLLGEGPCGYANVQRSRRRAC